LEVEIALNGSGSKRLTLFINHLKSKLASTPAERQRADELRERQAQAVKKTIESRFPGEQFNQEFFAVIGDLNDEPLSAPLKPLVSDAGLIDALALTSHDASHITLNQSVRTQVINPVLTGSFLKSDFTEIRLPLRPRE